MNTQEEYEQLKRNNRRRLIGAIVVVAIAAAILLKVLNHNSKPVSVAQVDIGGAVSQTSMQTKTTELPNPLTSDETVNISSSAGSDIAAIEPPVDAAGVANDQTAPAVTTSSSVNTVSPTKPVVTTSPSKSEAKVQRADSKPPLKNVSKTPATPEKNIAKPVKKLSPQEILDGKAGKAKGQTTAARNVAGRLIQAGAFLNARQAEVQRERLAKIGIQSKVYRAKTAKGEVYRVRIGPLASDSEAQNILNILQRNGFDGIVIRK